jgi:UDP-glucuronate 4-epimerase
MILVTGAAGFIGYHVSLRLLRDGHRVCGVDHLSDYYAVSLKEARVRELTAHPDFRFERIELAEAQSVAALFQAHRPTAVVHLAAQAGVRHSLTHPRAYVDSNVTGLLNVLEGCRHLGVKHLVYASSSSVYGLNTELPFSVHAGTDHPVSLYAATKKANELMAHSYSHLFGIPTTGLRLFTVYGPWGRPDMALFTFTKAILEGKPIEVFGGGRMRRDFTYIDDAVEGIARILGQPAAPDPAWSGREPDPATSSAPYRIYNIGNRSTVEVLRLIEILEACLGRQADKRFVESAACEVQASVADTADLERTTGFTPTTPLETGVGRFVAWYRDYYRI